MCSVGGSLGNNETPLLNIRKSNPAPLFGLKIEKVGLGTVLGG